MLDLMVKLFNKVIAPDVLKMRMPLTQIQYTQMLEPHVLESLAHITISLLHQDNVNHANSVKLLITTNHNVFQQFAQVDNSFQSAIRAINSAVDNKLANAKIVMPIPHQHLITNHALLPLAQLTHIVITMDLANYVQEAQNSCNHLMESHVLKSNAQKETNTLITKVNADHAQHTRL